MNSYKKIKYLAVLDSIKKDASIARTIHESCYLRQARPNGQHVDLSRYIRQLLPHGFHHFSIFLITLQYATVLCLNLFYIPPMPLQIGCLCKSFN